MNTNTASTCFAQLLSAAEIPTPNLSCPAYPVKPGTYGPDFNQQLDGTRLQTQLEVIADYMAERVILNQWVTLEEIEEATGYTTASISAQLRHLRKPQFGGHTVEKRRRQHANGSVGGTFEYMVIFRG